MKTLIKSFIIPLIGFILLASPALSKVYYSDTPVLVKIALPVLILLIFLLPSKQRAGTIAGVVGQLGLTNAYNKAFEECVAAYIGDPQNPQMSRAQAIEQVNQAVLSQSYLRLEIALAQTQNLYTLQILNNQTNGGVATRPTEQRLAQQDSFFASSIGIYLAKAASATDSAFPLQTFPDPVTFATGAASLYTVYNGKYNININNSTIVPAFPLSEFLQIPQTQLTAATNSPVSQFDPAQVALLQPNINFVGTKQSVINVVLPANPATLDNFTYLVVILHGVLAQNITLMS